MDAPPYTIEALDQPTLYALYGASRAMARATTATEVYASLLAALGDGFGCAAAAIYRPDEAGEGLRIARAASFATTIAPPPRLAPDPAWLAALGRTGAQLEPYIADGAGPATPGERFGRHCFGGRACLVGAAAIGVGPAAIVLVAWPPSAASAAGLAPALAALAEDTTNALARLARSRLDHGDGQLLAAINAMTDIGLLYSGLLDRLLTAVLGQILGALRLGGGAIMLGGEQGETLELAVAAVRPELEGEAELAALWAEPLLGEARAIAVATARSRGPNASPRLVAVAHDQPLGAALGRLGVDGLVCVPLLAGGWLTGVLQVVATPGSQLAPGQLQALAVLARQTAVAIENGRLFAQTRADQERTRAVVDASNDAILMLDEHRRPLIVNRRARFFFGLNERDLQGKSFAQLRGLFGRIFAEGSRFNDWLEQLLRSRSERAVDEYGVLSPEPRLLQCYSAPVMDVQDRYLGRILVFRDITREREVERMKNDFVSIVSHELRTPLTSIQGALQLVLGKPGGEPASLGAGLPQRGRDLLSISLANSERLIRLINDILDIAKIEQGRVQLRREILTPEELCRSAAAAMSALANEKEITIELQLPGWLPPVLADRDRSLQILINLLSNAIKFSPAGQRVRLGAQRDGQMICFTVEDWGRGIAPEDQARIFQKFQQIDSSATREVGGTGLGLAISKALVEEQGGRMWLASEPAKGSSFSFTLPLAPGGDGLGRRLVALVGEADPTLRTALCGALEAAGWEARPAASAQALLALAQGGEAEVVVIGLPLPGSRPSLLAELRGQGGAGEATLLLLTDSSPAELPPNCELLPRASEVVTIAARAEALRAMRRPLVLVVDDDPHVRPVLVRLLQRHGLRVANAGDGYSALAAVEQQRPDAILLDIRMPRLDGFEVLRRLKANPATATIPVIILTANDLSEPTRSEGTALGARAFLEKPITYETLTSTVNRVLRGEG